MKKYILRSNFDCLIKNEENEKLLDSNAQIIFEKPETVLVYPLQCNKFSLPFVLDLTQSSDTENYKVIKYEDNILFYLNSPYSIKNEIIEEISCGDKTCEIGICQTEISFKVSNIKKTIPILEKYKTYHIQSQKSFVILSLTGVLDSVYMFNVKTHSLSFLQGEKVEILDNKIFVTKPANDIVGHQIYDTYVIEDDKLNKLANKFKSDPQKSLKNSLIPLAFIEAIKIEDYLLAMEYLEEKIRKETTPDHLKKYFGQILNFIPIEENLIAVTNPVDTKIYKFTVLDNKIKEIELFR